MQWDCFLIIIMSESITTRQQPDVCICCVFTFSSYNCHCRVGSGYHPSAWHWNRTKSPLNASRFSPMIFTLPFSAVRQIWVFTCLNKVQFFCVYVILTWIVHIFCSNFLDFKLRITALIPYKDGFHSFWVTVLVSVGWWMHLYHSPLSCFLPPR